MNTAGKFRSLLDMSRKQSKFIQDDWVDIGRYRMPEPSRSSTDNGLYPSRPIPPFTWHFEPNSRNYIVDSTHSTAMKRVNETHHLPTPKSPKMQDEVKNPDCCNLGRHGISSPFHEYQNTNAINVGTYFPFPTPWNNASASNRPIFRDFSRPSYEKMLTQHFHHSANRFSDDTPGTSATDISNAQRHSPGSGPSSSIPAHQSKVGEMTERFQLHREWHTIDSPSIINAAVLQPIRIASYNILSQTLLELNRYLYRKCNPHILHWDYRWEKLQKEIQELSADILCLQEVEEYHFERDISKFLGRSNYECHYKRRTGNDKKKPDGVLIAFKKDKFQLLESRKVEYRRGNVSPVNQDNVAVITVLKPCGGAGMPEDSRLCVVNTHLLYNPKRGDIKLAQLSTLFAEVHDILSSHNASKVPILMCGDFNSVPKSCLFNFITTQELNYAGLASKYVSGQRVGSKGQKVLLPKYLLPQCLSISREGCVKVNEDKALAGPGFRMNHSLGALLSSYCHDEPQATTTQDRGVTVDYIFYTPDDDCALSLRPNRRLSLVSPRSLAAARGIPNAVHPSDHLPIVVDFDLVLPERSAKR